MLHRLVAMRGLIAMGLAAAVGAWGLHAHPVDMADPFLGLIEARSPGVFVALVYGYAALWFTTPFFGASLVLSLFAIAASRRDPRIRTQTSAGLCEAGESAGADARVGRDAFREHCRPCAESRMADDPTARALHGRDGCGRRRHWENIGVHVPLRRAIASLACGRCRPQDRRPGARSEGRLLQAGARDSETGRTGARLHRDWPRVRVIATTLCTTISTRTRWRSPSLHS